MNHHFEIYHFVILALTCAASCWILLSLILRCIFRPIQPRMLLGLKIQGILPAQKEQIIASLFAKVEQTLLSQKENLTKNITSAENVEKLMPEIEKHIENFLTVKLPQDIPMLAMFIGEKTIHQIKEVFMKELRTLLPKVLESFMDKMLVPGNIQKILADNIQPSAIDQAILNFEQKSKSQFVKIKLAATLFGLLFGAVIYTIIYWLT